VSRSRRKILVVGSGGREHALAWKAAQSPAVDAVFVAPGNAGTMREARVCNVGLAADDIDGLLEFATTTGIDLTIVGPEGPLVAGIVDRFIANGLRCFGPTLVAAQLEGSKNFAKEFMLRHGIPSAASELFSDYGSAEKFIDRHVGPLVIKADGLAAGKGVVIAPNREVAAAAAQRMLVGGEFGDAGRRILIEEFLTGEEASFIAIVAGEQVAALATSQDHKARSDGDTGPNTGGMGAYSPAPVVTPELHDRIMREVMQPTARGLVAEGSPYYGFLYAGLMIGIDGAPRVLEYNCRFGDPETQPILMRLRSDLVDLCERALENDIGAIEWDPRPALGVVMAAQGYPGEYRRGDAIKGLDGIDSDSVKVFHAGTVARDRDVLTNGGRVMCVTALGDNVFDANRRAYRAVAQIDWGSQYYRSDIGHRAIVREAGATSRAITGKITTG
jgi:phosphoribosylamine--glycine ligase